MRGWVGVAGLLVVTLIGCRTSHPPPPQNQKTGCTVTVNQTSQTALYEPLIIVGEREGVDDYGDPVQEWWVWFPGRPEDEFVDMHGNRRAVNIKKSKVLFRNEMRLIKGVMCKCPGD